MKAFLLAAMLAFSFFSINFAGAFSSSILNGDFSSALPQATPVCNYFINGSSPSARDCSLGTSSLSSLPVSWGVDTNISNTYFEGGNAPVFDSVRIISDNVVSGGHLYHSAPFAVILWSTIPGALHPDSFCSYNSNLVPNTALTCSGAGQPGNYTAEGFIKQTVNINKSGAILHYWVSTAFSVPNFNKINQSSDGEYYTCSAGSDLSPAGFSSRGNDCGISNPRYRVWIKRLFANGTANDTLNLVEDSASRGAVSENFYQEKSLPINANAGDNVTIVFASVGLNFAPTTLSAIELDDVSIEYPADTAAMATKFISDHETLTPVGIDSANATDATPGVVFDVAGIANQSFILKHQISRNFSDFYKFDFNVTIRSKSTSFTSLASIYLCTAEAVAAGSCVRAGNYPKDFLAFDAAGNVYNISSSNVRNKTLDDGLGCGCQVSFEIYGYIPSNTTQLVFTVRASVAANEEAIAMNFSMNPTTINNRHKWFYPVLNSNETWNYAYPVFFHNFSYNPSSQNLSFWAYNFRNSTGFYPSLNLSEGLGNNNVFLYDSSDAFLASGTDARTYFQEYNFDFSNIAFDNAAIVGNKIIINRTSANPWYNETKTISQSKFILSVAGVNAGCSNFCASTQSCTQGTSGNVLCTVDPSTCLFTATPNSPTCGGTAPAGPSANGTQNTSSGNSFDVGDIAGAYRTPINTLFRPDFIWIMVPFIVIFAVEIYSMVKTGHALGLDFRVWLGFVAAWIFVGTFLVAIIGPLAGILIIAALVLLIVGRTYQAVVGGGTG